MNAFRLRQTTLTSGILLSLLTASAAPAQRAAAYAPSPASASIPTDTLSWLPQGITALSQQATSHTDFTFDRSVLGLVSNLPNLDEPTRQVIARLNGISVHVYKFARPGSYDPSALNTIRDQYTALGWKHIVSKGGVAPNGGFDANDAQARTDVWLETKGINFAGATILLAGLTNVELIAVSGDISTLDLLRLRGHFGIPNFPDNGLNH